MAENHNVTDDTLELDITDDLTMEEQMSHPLITL